MDRSRGSRLSALSPFVFFVRHGKTEKRKTQNGKWERRRSILKFRRDKTETKRKRNEPKLFVARKRSVNFFLASTVYTTGLHKTFACNNSAAFFCEHRLKFWIFMMSCTIHVMISCILFTVLLNLRLLSYVFYNRKDVAPPEW